VDSEGREGGEGNGSEEMMGQGSEEMMYISFPR